LTLLPVSPQAAIVPDIVPRVDPSEHRRNQRFSSSQTGSDSDSTANGSSGSSKLLIAGTIVPIPALLIALAIIWIRRHRHKSGKETEPAQGEIATAPSKFDSVCLGHLIDR
jgi:hypothetical protein